MIKNLVRISVGVLSTLLALVVLWQFRIAVIFVLISLMLAASIRPFFTRLVGKKLFVKILWIFIYILVVVGLLLVTLFTVQASATEIHALAQRASAQDEWKVPEWLGVSLQETIRTWLPLPSVLLLTIIGPEGELVLPALIGIAQNIGAIVGAGAIILILSIYWGISQVHFERLWLSLLPSDQRKRARDIWQTVEDEIGAYIRGQGVFSLLIGFLLGFGCWIFGSPSPALLGLIGALASMVPVVGGVLIIVPTLIIGLLTSAEIALITGIYAIIVLIVVQIWIKPKLFNRRWDNPILTLILMIVLADVFGIVGIILAPPISAIFLIFWNHLVVHRVAAGSATQLSDLKERLAKITETINAMDEPYPPLINHSVARITKLIAAAEPELSRVVQVDSTYPTAEQD
ncbi:MAG: AI-2E family transporter [Anaerolineaceae bacterium]|nr:AI-2E family transporter [Anaerolineaceae bacterium]